MSKINNIISKDKINTTRQIEIDLFRGITAIILIICHTILYLGDNTNNVLYTFGDIIGSEFGAPVFMSLMGISICFTTHNSPKELFKRGIILFISGCILNIIRSLIPYLLIPNVNYFSTFDSLFVVDILPFAGTSFMVIALFKKLKLRSFIIVLIAIVLGIIDEIYFNISSSININNILKYFINLFIPLNEYSCFPFFTWFFFPAFGMLLGDILIRTKNKNKLYLFYLIIGFISLLIIYGSMIYYYPNYQEYYSGNNFYYMGSINLILNGLLICFGCALWYFISKILPSFITKYLSFLSSGLNVFYWISWVIIGSLYHIFTYYNIVLKTYIVIILIIVILIIDTLLTKLYYLIKHNIKQKNIK